ncbi:MAG: GMC family oxidoreductase N-terminal domain-containing protein, partial [Pyrinomonadaceae bacterium]|nr:GMC family oxidoreductase N-terminal domain-containing protein [Pyrinomonadaceae bacterium]
LDESARELYGSGFITLDADRQDEVLRLVQRGEVASQTWRTLSPIRFFEELLAEVTEIYYSHPLAQEEIGYVGMADARGWQNINLDNLETWEPRAGSVFSAEREPAHPHTPHPQGAKKDDLPRFEMRTYMTSDTVDAVVVGTGAGGAPLLARLAQAGLSVVALEAGKFWNPARDFATDERAQSKLFWTDERLSAGGDPLHFGNNNSGIGVGGSTLHFTAYTPRAQADDFRLKSEFGVGVDWSISYDDLEPYYDELERFLGVSGPTPYPWGRPRKNRYPLAPLGLNGAAELMQRACVSLGIRTSPAPNAALSAPYFQEGVGWRAACTNRGFCQAGCTTGAKASMDVTYIPLAVQSGAEVRSECFVTSFERDSSGSITSVIYIRDGREERQRCKSVFLCAGAIETPRLLLINNLANSSGQVGRNFMAHTGVQVWGRFDEDVRPYKGIPGSLISEDTHRPADSDFAGGYLLQSIGVMPVTYASQVARGRGAWGEGLRDHMRGYNHTAGINILGDCLPYAGNYVELSDESDARGLPKPRVHFTNGENECRMNAHAEKRMRQIWAAAGACEMWTYQRNAHIIGTCRSGTDAGESVVNSEGQSFDVPNLYISDNSTFPSALAVNPALTIMALSLRTADCFLERVRKLEA